MMIPVEFTYRTGSGESVRRTVRVEVRLDLTFRLAIRVRESETGPTAFLNAIPSEALEARLPAFRSWASISYGWTTHKIAARLRRECAAELSHTYPAHEALGSLMATQWWPEEWQGGFDPPLPPFELDGMPLPGARQIDLCEVAVGKGVLPARLVGPLGPMLAAMYARHRELRGR